jgi:iron complex outermembrane receptor protein
LGFGLLAFAAPALAAEDEEIIVTARRVEERLQDVPASITVFNQKQLNDRNISSVQGIALYTPSVTVKSNFSPDVATFNIRGFTQESRTTATVGVYMADVIAPRASSQGASPDGLPPGMVYDLQNIQVLKGPQGTLFGRNTTGGAVLLVPTKPKREFGGYIEGSYGNYDMKRLQGVLNVPLGSKARLRVGFDRMTRDGYINNISGIGPRQLNDVNYIGGRAGLSVDITPNLENYTLAMISNSDHVPPTPKLLAVNPAVFVAGGVLPTTLASAAAQVDRLNVHGTDFYNVENDGQNPRISLQEWWLINTTTWHATDLLTIKNIASYSVYVEKIGRNNQGTNFTDSATGLHYYGIYNFAGPNQNTNDSYNITDELQFQGRSGNNKFTWQAGLYYDQSTPRSSSGASVLNRGTCQLGSDSHPVCANGSSFTLSYAVLRFRDMAAYAQGTYAILDNLKLDAGFRFTHDETKGWQINKGYVNTTGAIADMFTLPLQTFAPGRVGTRATSDAPTWHLGLNYNPTPDILTYIKYDRGYRQGAVLTGSSNPPTYAPEIVDVYEIGTKHTFQGKVPGILNLAAYYATFGQQQIQVSSFVNSGGRITSTPLIFNAGNSHMWGVELESTLKPFENFRVDASASYLFTKLDSALFPPAGPGVVAFLPVARVNGPLPFSPKYKVSITGTYTLPVPETVGTIEFSATYSYQSPYESSISPTPTSIGLLGSPFHTADAENIVNLNLNWNRVFDGPVDAAFFVTNLLDDTYYTYTNGTYYLPPAASAAGFANAELGEPRMFGGRLKLRFGADAHY